MPIRFSKAGSTLRFSAKAIVASASLWFGSVVYAQSQPAFEVDAAPRYRQTQQRSFEQQGQRFSPSNRLANQAVANHSQPQWPTNARAQATTTERVDLSSLSQQSVQRLLGNQPATNPPIAQPRPELARPRTRIVTDHVYNSPAAQTANIVSRLTESPSQNSSFVAQPQAMPAAERPSTEHQLTSISMVDFEQKLVNRFGDQLQATSSEDGRFVRVSIPTQALQNGDGQPMTMLVDRKTGKLRYDGAASLTGVWNQLISQLDSSKPVSQAPTSPIAKATYESRGAASQQVKQVAFQQQDERQNRGTPVQGIPGLKGQVFVAQDAFGNLTLTGDPDDVAIVKREIARLSAQAKSTQPTPESISLENARGNLIQERVQEIYNESYAPVNGPANITATDSPNSLVVVGSPEAVQAVRNLVKLLDVKPDPRSAKDFFTFGLKYISSNDAATRLRSFFGQVTFSTGDARIPEIPVEVIPDFRSNQVTVKGSQAIINAAADFLKSIDVDSVEDGAVNEVRIIRLKNALASDVAFVIQNAINGQQPNAPQAFAPSTGGQTAQQPNIAQAVQDTAGNQSQLRSAMLSFMTRNAQGDLIKSGIMFDVGITADVNSNSLIVTGPAASIPLIVELVKQLDRLPNAESQIKVFELVYSDAQTIFDMLDTLFNSQNQNAGGQAGQTGGTSSLPLQTGGGSDGASLINLRFSIEPRSNAIIASGPVRDLQVIEDLLNRLDARAVNNFPAQVYRLSNAPAQDVADAINTYLDGRTDLIDADPRTQTGVPAVSRAIIVTPEVVSNSLIVSALPEYLGEIENIIRSLDRRPPMVQVKVLIAEVDLDAVEEFGVELGIQDSLLFDRGTSIAAGGALTGIGFPFNTPTVPNLNAVGREAFPAQALSNLNVGRVSSNVGFGGLVLSAGNESVSLLLRALKNRNCVRVLSSPQLMTLENLQGRVSIGASVARIAGSTNTNFGATQNIVFEDVGVILEVTPRVSPDGLIVLTVNAENSSVGPVSSGTAVGTAADGSIIFAQQILKTEATTTLSARSGQTVVFSGLITESKSHEERGIPIISDLPVVGPLFKFESDVSSRSELLIIMTPTLVTSDSDLTAVNNESIGRMHWCEADVAEVFGNTGYNSGIDDGQPIETCYPDADPTGTMQTLMHESNVESPGQVIMGGNSEAGGTPVVEQTQDRSAHKPLRKLFDRR